MPIIIYWPGIAAGSFNDAWFHAASSQPYFTITGLIPGNVYSFKIGVTGSKGQVAYTDIITKMVI
ncbi:MAG: hypothetical protein ABIQ88_03725 [Chitinophagaceae bacterium]